MWNFLIKINKRLVAAIPAMMATGYLFGFSGPPDFLNLLKDLILPFTFLMVCPMMVALDIKSLRGGVKNARLQLFGQGVNFAVSPFLAYGLGLIFFRDQPYMALGLLLVFLLPAGTMIISWTALAGGNIPAAVNMTLIGLVLGSLAIPVYVPALLGAGMDLNLMPVVGQIVAVVFLPMLFGYFVRPMFLKKYGAQDFKQTWAPRLSSLSMAGVLGIVFVIFALKAREISENPIILGDILVPLLIMYGLSFGIGVVAGRLLFNRSEAIVLVYGTVIRNLSIALAVAVNGFGAMGMDAALVIAVAYIVQIQSAVWCVKFNDRIFGPTPGIE